MESLLCRLLVEGGAEILDLTPFSLLFRMKGGAAEATLNLANLRRQTLSLGEAEKAQAIRVFAKAALRGMAKVEAPMLTNVFPRIVADIENKSLSAPWSAVLVKDALRLILVEDLGHALRQVQPMKIVEWGRPLAEIRSAAMANLRRISVDTSPAVEADGTLVFRSGDGHDAARALIADTWLKGPVFFATPARDLLLLRADAPTKALMASTQAAFEKMPYAISPAWRRLDEGQFSDIS